MSKELEKALNNIELRLHELIREVREMRSNIPAREQLNRNPNLSQQSPGQQFFTALTADDDNSLRRSKFMECPHN